MATEICIEVVT